MFIHRDIIEGIHKEFKVANYSSVSSIIESVKLNLVRNKKLKKHVDNIKRDLQLSQQQTCPPFSFTHAVFDVVVDACPEPRRRDEVEFFFGETVMFGKDFVNSSTAESFMIRESLLPNNEGDPLHSNKTNSLFKT